MKDELEFLFMRVCSCFHNAHVRARPLVLRYYSTLARVSGGNTQILCITLTVEHNYFSLSTVGNTTTCFGPIGGPSS